ncbi:MAG: proline dehydrogenase family protein [Anaerolineaceae bacterium]|nr:proline dehydrogenase family protein [Anaerolineaceae bacterium]
MLRRVLLYFSHAGWARHIVTGWGLAKRVARRFVAGETLDEAIAVVRTLNQKGMGASLDFLGESVTHAEDTREVVATYRRILARISEEKLDASVSLKLTHFGLDISEDLCQANLREVLTDAQQGNIPVTIDMENTPYTDTTLRIYRTMRDEYGFTNVGTVIQSYLRRSEKDMQELAAEGAHIRLCKGAYLEPPEHAFPEKADVDRSYVRITEQYLASPAPAYLCVASHDENMIVAAENFARDHQIPRDRYEFQMLYGIRTARQEALAAEGYAVRIYVPFGEAWYPYFMRRLAERPANLWFFLRSMFRA